MHPMIDESECEEGWMPSDTVPIGREDGATRWDVDREPAPKTSDPPARVKTSSRWNCCVGWKWTQTVFSEEKQKPINWVQLSRWLMASCIYCSADGTLCEQQQMAKSLTYKDAYNGGRTCCTSAKELIATAKRIELKILPCGTPFSGHTKKSSVGTLEHLHWLETMQKNR